MNNKTQNTDNKSLSPERVDNEYRLVSKKYYCHICKKEFKKMSPAQELVEVECPNCHETFVEEIENNV